MQMPTEPSGPPPARLMPQYGGRYMPPAEQWGAEVDAAGLGPSQLVDVIQARQAYDASPAAARADLARTAGDKGQLEGALAGGLYEQQAQQAEQRAALEEQKRAELKAMQAEQLERQNARRAALDAEMTRYRQAVDTARSSDIDPERLWNSKTTGQKVLSKIAVFLGGIAQGLGGMGGRPLPNAALEQLNLDIDRDIDAQKANAAGKRNDVSLRGTVLDMMRQHYDDDERAGMAAKAAVLDRYASLTESMALDAASKDARLRGAALALEMRRQRDELEKALQVSAIDQEEAEYQARLAAAAAAAQQQAELAAQIENLDWKDFNSKDVEGRWIDGLGLLAATDDDAKVIKGAAAQAAGIVDGLDGMMSEIDKGADRPWTEVQSTYEAKRGMLAAAINVLGGQGAISKDDWDRVQMSLPAVGTFDSRANAIARLRATKELLVNGVRKQAMVRGALPVDERLSVVRTGKKPELQRQVKVRRGPSSSGILGSDFDPNNVVPVTPEARQGQTVVADPASAASVEAAALRIARERMRLPANVPAGQESAAPAKHSWVDDIAYGGTRPDAPNKRSLADTLVKGGTK
jgi:hypothetical protein